jgi:hypothetical protein
VNVYRNETVLPRAFVVHHAVVAADHEDAWKRTQEPGFDPSAMVVLEGGQPLDLQPGAGTEAQVTRYDTNALEIQIDNPAEGYLFLSDPYYPGWEVQLDGRPAELLRANYAFRAVAVPAGAHQVTMTFRPRLWTGGLGITSLTLLVLLVLTVLAWVRGRRD